jgi:hypothetical protein
MEVYKSKAGGRMGLNIFKQYSMVRANSNDGFVYSGTTKGPNGQDVIHILKTDDNLATVWSYYYEVSNVVSFNSTKICKTYDENGCFISGYLQVGSTNQALILQIDNTGILLNNTAVNSHEGVFLDVEPTSDGGCIAVGFQSHSIELAVPSIPGGGRRGLIMKFSNALTIDWSRAFHANTRLTTDDYFHDLAENVTVINSSSTGNVDYYFVMGGVTDFNGVSINSTLYNGVNAYYAYIDNVGNLVYDYTFKKDLYVYDACYFPNEHKIYFTGKYDYYAPAPSLVVGDISLFGGTVNNLKTFDGDVNESPSAHIPIGYKIECDGDDVWIYGHVREYHFGTAPNILAYSTMIPFRFKMDRISYNPIEFIINHSNTVNTDLYVLESPGWLNARDNVLSVYYLRMPSNFVPEMGLSYIDENSVKQFAYISYFNNFRSPARFDLHLVNTFLEECEPLERSMMYNSDLNGSDLETYFVSTPELNMNLIINRNLMNLNDENCDE